jgi:ubiquitin C-terminal hydrolase
LKIFILFALAQEYKVDTNFQKYYLINPEWLEHYQFQKIKNLVKSKLDKIASLWNTSYDLNSLSQIIPILDPEKLKKYDSKMMTNPQKDFLVPSEKISAYDKYIDIYGKFVLANENIFNLLKKYFQIKQESEEVYCSCLKNYHDFVVIKNHKIINFQNQINLQNSILIGIIKRDENKFKVEHILDYKDKITLENEMKHFNQSNYPNYIFSRTCVTQENKECFSPIFDKKVMEIIGNYYRYQKQYDPRQLNNFSNYLSNNQLWAIFYLYYNDQLIKSKLIYPEKKDEEFYIIKKDLLSDIKKENNYDNIKQYLEQNLKQNLVKYFNGKITIKKPNGEIVYSTIKPLPPNEMAKLAHDLKQEKIVKDSKEAYEIEIFPIKNPNDQNEVFMVYKNFELVEKSIAHQYLEKFPYHILKCSISEYKGDYKIIFHYKINQNNKKSFYIISRIDENYNFINEYLLIYFEQIKYKQIIQNHFEQIKYKQIIQNHFEQIKYKPDNFLDGLVFVNNTAPILVGEYIEIGLVIRLKEEILPIPIPPDDIKDSLKDFPSKPLIGLENIGATCYMNATLQCICNIKRFVDYFKYSPHLADIIKNDILKEKLSTAFKLLIENLYPYKLSKNYENFLKRNPRTFLSSKKYLKKSYAPRNFKDTISRMNPLFEGIAANDAKDLVNFLIMTLHGELNKAPPEKQNEIMGNLLQDQTNKMLMFNNFIENFKKTHQSIISDLFYALNCNITQCQNCQIISYNYQIYFFLIFPLEEVRKFKLMNNSNNFNFNFANENLVDIYDCFNFDRKINFMINDNAMYCNYCKQTCNSSMRTILTTGPAILIIILNRGKGIEFKVKINFYLDLDLSNYIELQDTGCKYDLFGVITHIGESSMSGHFISYCKSYWDNNWYKFNDAIVTPVKDFQTEVIDFAMPYLLFYKKNN